MHQVGRYCTRKLVIYSPCNKNYAVVEQLCMSAVLQSIKWPVPA